MKSLTTEAILLRIAQLQAVQKAHPPSSGAWETASNLLSPLFEEMALREAHPHFAAAHPHSFAGIINALEPIYGCRVTLVDIGLPWHVFEEDVHWGSGDSPDAAALEAIESGFFTERTI